MRRVWFQAAVYWALLVLAYGAVQGVAADGNTPLLPEAVRAEVDALKKEDVAWRRIAWKTCLLDGLKASREQGKPIMLWIFIDRPIDDERC